MTTAPPQPAPLAWQRSRAWIAGAVLTLVLVLFCAGPRADVALARLLSEGVVLIAWLAAAWGWGSLLPATRRTPGPLGDVTATAMGLGLMGLAVLGLGVAGAMNMAVAWLIVGGGAIAAANRFMRSRRVGPREAPSRWRWLWIALAPMLAMAIVAALVPPGIMWGDEPHPYDVVEYHLQLPREWYELGRITPLEHNVFSYFPLGVEMHYLLAMQLRGGPWAGMYLAQLMHLAMVALSVAGVYAVVRQTRPAASATLAGIAAAAVPWMGMVGSVAYNEGGLLLFGTLAIGWGLVALRDQARSWRAFALAGAMAGFACGMKLTAGPLLLAGWPVVLLIAGFVARRPWRPLVLGVVLYGAIGTVTFAPWLIRTAVASGNPVFPEAQSLLGRGHFTPDQSERWARAHAPQPDQRSIGARFVAAHRQIVMNDRYGWTILSLGLVGAALSIRRRETGMLLGMLAVLCVFWLGFTHLQGRFFILAIPLAALLIGQVERGRPVMLAGVCAAVVVGTVVLQMRFQQLLYPDSAQQPIHALGVEDLRWATPLVDNVRPDQLLALIGDARAFLYRRPMARLSYRTVFDIAAGADADPTTAWTQSAPADAVLLIAPSELRRFEATYQPLPPAPGAWTSRPEPFLVQR